MKKKIREHLMLGFISDNMKEEEKTHEQFGILFTYPSLQT